MIGQALVALVAVIHIGIVLAEMLFWESGPVRRAFGMSEVFAANTRVLAANQGLYNGFLVAGLIWALQAGLPGDGAPVAHFFLSCVIVAGLYGGRHRCPPDHLRPGAAGGPGAGCGAGGRLTRKGSLRVADRC